MADRIFEGDIGTVFEVEIQEDDVALDISAATAMTIKFEKTDGTVVAKTAVFTTDGSDGLIRYVTVAGDLDQPGLWRLQGHVTLPSWSGSSTMDRFRVHKALIAT